MVSIVEPHLDEICDRLASGNSMRSICAELGLDEGTVRWFASRNEEARTRIAAARELGCDALADQVLEIADTPKIGERVKIDSDGEEEITREDMLGHRRLQIDARLRLIGKWSQRYGDKVEHSGPNGGAIPVAVASKIDMSALTDEQLRALASIRVPTE